MSECIIWAKSKNEKGYGQAWFKGKHYKAHRLAYELAFGPIPNGMVVDHTCHNEAAKNGECLGGFDCVHRSCVNVAHLRLVTQGENILSGLHSVDVKASCPKGHSYSDLRNVYVRKNGKRECAECNRIRARQAYAAVRLGV